MTAIEVHACLLPNADLSVGAATASGSNGAGTQPVQRSVPRMPMRWTLSSVVCNCRPTSATIMGPKKEAISHQRNLAGMPPLPLVLLVLMGERIAEGGER